MKRFQEEDVLCAPVLDYAAFRSHPQVQHQNLFRNLQQPGMGDIPLASLPGLPDSADAPAPFLGEHTVEVLEQLGLESSEIAALEENRIIYARPNTQASNQNVQKEEND